MSFCSMDCSTEGKSNPRLLPIKLKHDNIKQFIRLSQWRLLREKESSDEIIELELLSQD